MEDFISMGDAAKHFRTQVWRIRRLFETETLPEPPRFDGRRVIPRDLLPKLRAALKERGWLNTAKQWEPQSASN